MKLESELPVFISTCELLHGVFFPCLAEPPGGCLMAAKGQPSTIVWVVLSVPGVRAVSYPLIPGQNATTKVEMCNTIWFWCSLCWKVPAFCALCCCYQQCATSCWSLPVSMFLSRYILCHGCALLHGVKFPLMWFPVSLKYTLDWTSCGENEDVPFFFPWLLEDISYSKLIGIFGVSLTWSHYLSAGESHLQTWIKSHGSPGLDRSMPSNAVCSP